MTGPNQGVLCNCAGPVCGVYCFCICCAPVFLCPRYGTKKGQTAQPWVTPALAIPGGDRLEAAAGRGALACSLRGLLPRRPVRRVLQATAVKISFQVDVPAALAPVVLRDAALDIARCLHRTPAQAFRPEGIPKGQATRPLPHVLAQVAGGVPAGHHLLDDAWALPA